LPLLLLSTPFEMLQAVIFFATRSGWQLEMEHYLIGSYGGKEICR